MRHNSTRILALGVILAVLYFGRVFFITAITAVIFSFILAPFVRALTRLRLPRGLAAAVVLALACLVLYAAGIAIYSQTAGLMAQMPQFAERVGRMSDTVQTRIGDFEQSAYKLVARQPPPPPPPPPAPKLKTLRKYTAPAPALPPTIPEVRIHQDSSPLVNYVYARLGSVYEFLLMASFVPFLVYFLLSWGDRASRNFLLLFHGQDRLMAARSLTAIGGMVRAFVVGNFVLGALLAAVSAICFWMVAVPFPLLSGTVSGFLSLMPYVGLPLALVPPLFTALGGSADLGHILLIMLIVAGLHVAALNLLYPKVVGSRVHLNPLVVTFAIMFWGFFWDAAGLLLAIPVTAALKAVCDNVPRLNPYGRFLGD